LRSIAPPLERATRRFVQGDVERAALVDVDDLAGAADADVETVSVPTVPPLSAIPAPLVLPMSIPVTCCSGRR
jgi:hypothetical protein